MSQVELRVVFEKPGWFANDPRVVVTLDGRPLHDGSFLSGFEATVLLDAGPHVLETAIHVGLLGRRRRYDLELGRDAGYREGGLRRWVARLEYSRFWGSFARKLDLREA